MTELINVDFDKTLTSPTEDEWMPAYQQNPNQKIIDAVNEAYTNGNKIVVWTARQWNEAPQVAGWLTAHEVPYHGLKCGKGGADRYIDDKAVTPEEFIENDTT